ncbi:Hexokinase-3 [Coemansia sp. RSA 1822]|nr:Hexokinase-3 [Coemansia sp. RSA 638]KAJ2544420.1 Hexokinase-3 [Coemansia sp. RSA 1853]KAJ2565395.1 Hexokinase-3 [Coemansia sp. RSA 1822]
MNMLSKEQQAFLDLVTKSFAVSDDVLNTLVTRVHAELFRGLASNTSRTSELLMKPSFIRPPLARPSSVSLGMSISGSRIRITSICVDAKSTPTRSHTQVFTMHEHQSVFDFAAYCVREFVQHHKLDSSSLPLGVTIVPSESTEYTELHSSDAGRKLCAAFVRSHLNVHVTAITRGAVSALVASRIKKSTRVAAVFDGGVDVAYVEQLGQVSKLRVSDETKSSLVAIDTDIGNFGSRYNALPVTMWDRRVDRESNNSGRVFEKLVGGRYLGELVRNLIVDMIDQRLLFTKCNVQEISVPYSLHTAYMGPIIDELGAVDAVFAAEFGINCSESDRRIIRTLCSIVMARAARVAGAVLAAVVLKAKADADDSVTVVLSGTVFDANPQMLDDTVREMQCRLPHTVKPEVVVQSPSDELFGAAINAACI